jgi:transcriptional regulator with XRE-family HTH domain
VNFQRKQEVDFMTFATNFKRICEERGTSPTRVCLDLGLSSSKVNLWNNGSLPKADVLIKLARKLECDVLDFFEGDADMGALRPVTSKTEFALDEDEKDIIRLFRTLSRQEKHAFMAQAYEYEKTHNKEEV